MVPFTCEGGRPCAVPGFSPMSPLIWLGPEPVIEAVAITANAAVAPRLIGAWAVCVPVVNVQTLSAASGLPARSFTPLAPPLIVAVYVVFGARLAEGRYAAMRLGTS